MGRAALLVALGASPALAARAEDPQDPALTVVVTGTRTPESGARAAVRTDVVTRSEAERRGATNVGEALRGQLGVQVNPSAHGQLGGPSAIQIQGFDRNNATQDETKRDASINADAVKVQADLEKRGMFPPRLLGPKGTLPGTVERDPAGGYRLQQPSDLRNATWGGPARLYIPTDRVGRPLPLLQQPVRGGEDIPLPDPKAGGRAHTVLGGKVSSVTGEQYRQSATFAGRILADREWPRSAIESR